MYVVVNHKQWNIDLFLFLLPHNEYYAVLENLSNDGCYVERGSMTDQELRKLSRADLLELLLEQSKENERLREQLKQAQEQLASRKIEIDNAGSIAEAALQLNGVFEAAEKAAAQYLENVRRLAEEAL